MATEVCVAEAPRLHDAGVVAPGPEADDIADVQRFGDVGVVASDDAGAPETLVVPQLSSPKLSSLHGIALTANDLQDPSSDEHHQNHARIQELLSAVLFRRGIDVASSSIAPHIDPAQEYNDADADHRRRALAHRIFGWLRERGPHYIRTFRRMLHHTDIDCAGIVLGRSFDAAMAHLGVRLKPSEYERLLELFAAPGEEQLVDYVRFLSFGMDNWSRQREEVVSEAYEVLGSRCPGGIVDAQALTMFQGWSFAEHGGAQEFLKEWSDGFLTSDGVITWIHFVEYYLDLSISFESDQEFCNFVCASWDINPDDWLAKKVFRRYTTADFEDSLPFSDFIRMLNELDPTTTPEEAQAWYRAIDEDNSGDVSLEEFLSSKVLKVKRLFDKFVPNDSRKADKDTMMNILKSLNSCITEEEAEAVYCYADLTNSGVVDFCDFLQNNLLKLLQIFDDFDRNRRRRFTAADMKKLLLQLDSCLSNEEVTAVYKAIDVDGSGEVSFAEFCESQMLRAKALFDRYDTTRGRALTQFKFRELMLEMDPTLTAKEMEAIYSLVVDMNDDMVHLAGFLNPNVVKLKLLFDKYDEDRSRFLDADEFRCMLKDIYKSCTDDELDSIVETICPAGEEGISFTTFFQTFKVTQRKHDLIHLAKRRAAREKAQSKGLLWDG